jgi:hypothetical protein
VNLVEIFDPFYDHDKGAVFDPNHFGDFRWIHYGPRKNAPLGKLHALLYCPERGKDFSIHRPEEPVGSSLGYSSSRARLTSVRYQRFARTAQKK